MSVVSHADITAKLQITVLLPSCVAFSHGGQQLKLYNEPTRLRAVWKTKVGGSPYTYQTKIQKT